MVVAESLQGGGRTSRNTQGGSCPMDFLGLMDLTQLAQMAPNHQVVASPADRENQGGRSNGTTNRTTGGEDGTHPK